MTKVLEVKSLRGNYITNRIKDGGKSIDFENKYKKIIENIKEPYFEVDLKGNFTFMNKSFVQMTGYSYEELMRKN